MAEDRVKEAQEALDQAMRNEAVSALASGEKTAEAVITAAMRGGFYTLIEVLLRPDPGNAQLEANSRQVDRRREAERALVMAREFLGGLEDTPGVDAILEQIDTVLGRDPPLAALPTAG